MENATENGGGDSVIDGGASEIELVFRPHPTLMEKDDAHNRCVQKRNKTLKSQYSADSLLFYWFSSEEPLNHWGSPGSPLSDPLYP